MSEQMSYLEEKQERDRAYERAYNDGLTERQQKAAEMLANGQISLSVLTIDELKSELSQVFTRAGKVRPVSGKRVVLTKHNAKDTLVTIDKIMGADTATMTIETDHWSMELSAAATYLLRTVELVTELVLAGYRVR